VEENIKAKTTSGDTAIMKVDNHDFWVYNHDGHEGSNPEYPSKGANIRIGRRQGNKVERVDQAQDNVIICTRFTR
jgi:hypothetical protein